MSAVDVLFLRHAETETTAAAARWHDSDRTPLSGDGRAHAERAGEALAGSAATWHGTVVCSTYVRSRETAAILARHLGLTWTATARLTERALGAWVGLSFSEIEAGWPGELDAWHRGERDGPPGGETDGEVTKRTTDALVHAVPVGTSGTVLVVGHAGLLRGMTATNGLPDAKIAPLSGRLLHLNLADRSLQVGPAVTY